MPTYDRSWNVRRYRGAKSLARDRNVYGRLHRRNTLKAVVLKPFKSYS